MYFQDDSVQRWLEQAGRHPLLTPSEELHLSQLVRTWLDADNPTPRQLRAGRRAKSRMMEGNLRLVVNVAKRYSKRLSRDNALSFEDLLAEGCLGLNRAVEKFDAARGYKFSTYSFCWIRQSISRRVELSGTIKHPTAAIQLVSAYKYKPIQMTDEEFCENRGITVEKLRTEFDIFARAQTRSLDYSACSKSGGELSTLLDMVPNPVERADYEEAQAEAVATLDVMRSALPDEMALIELAETGTREDIAELLGTTYQAVGRQVGKARRKCRELVPAAG